MNESAAPGGIKSAAPGKQPPPLWKRFVKQFEPHIGNYESWKADVFADGQMSKKEAKEAKFSGADANNDGITTEKEFDKYVEGQKKVVIYDNGRRYVLKKDNVDKLEEVKTQYDQEAEIIKWWDEASGDKKITRGELNELFKLMENKKGYYNEWFGDEIEITKAGMDAILGDQDGKFDKDLDAVSLGKDGKSLVDLEKKLKFLKNFKAMTRVSFAELAQKDIIYFIDLPPESLLKGLNLDSIKHRNFLVLQNRADQIGKSDKEKKRLLAIGLLFHREVGFLAMLRSRSLSLSGFWWWEEDLDLKKPDVLEAFKNVFQEFVKNPALRLTKDQWKKVKEGKGPQLEEGVESATPVK